MFADTSFIGRMRNTKKRRITRCIQYSEMCHGGIRIAPYKNYRTWVINSQILSIRSTLTFLIMLLVLSNKLFRYNCSSDATASVRSKGIGQMQLHCDASQSECLKRDFADSRVIIYLHNSHKTRLGTANRGLYEIGRRTPVSRCVF